MSEIAARSSGSKHLAVEYALLSLEIRKGVHGDQSRTAEIVESLLQIARMLMLKGSYSEAIKYFEVGAKSAEELKGGTTDRVVVEIQSEFALALFLIENYSLCYLKCEGILETFRKCGDHLLIF